MSKNIGAKVRRTFFINGTSGPVDFYEGIVRSVTCMMIMTVRKCPNVNLHTIVFPLKHRPMHTSRALGGIIA